MWDDIIRNIEKMMEDIFSDWEKDVERIKKEIEENKGKGYYYGFRYEIGPDGVPHFEEWDNISQKDGDTRTKIEKIGDVWEITVELKDMKKEDISVTSYENKLLIEAKNDKIDYKKELKFPFNVDDAGVHAGYENDKLKITIIGGKIKGRRIEIE